MSRMETEFNTTEDLIKLMHTWAAFKALSGGLHHTAIEENWDADKEKQALSIAAIVVNSYINTSMYFISNMTKFMSPRSATRIMLMVVQELMYSAIMTDRQQEGVSRTIQEIDEELFQLSEEGTKFMLGALEEMRQKHEFHQRIKPLEHTAPTVVGTSTKQ